MENNSITLFNKKIRFHASYCKPPNLLRLLNRPIPEKEDFVRACWMAIARFPTLSMALLVKVVMPCILVRWAVLCPFG
jgi:hypothetical protein